MSLEELFLVAALAGGVGGGFAWFCLSGVPALLGWIEDRFFSGKRVDTEGNAGGSR